MSLFAAPGDEEYEPEPAAPRPPSPRRFRNPELAAQARVDAESKAEKYALAPPRIRATEHTEPQYICKPVFTVKLLGLMV